MDIFRILFSDGPGGVITGIGAMLAIIGTAIGFVGAIGITLRISESCRTIFKIGGLIMVIGIVIGIAANI